MGIGSSNILGIKNYVLNMHVGDSSVSEAREEVKNGVICKYNIIVSDPCITKKNIGYHSCIFYHGIMKQTSPHRSQTP